MDRDVEEEREEVVVAVDKSDPKVGWMEME